MLTSFLLWEFVWKAWFDRIYPSSNIVTKDYLVSIQIEMLQPFKIINWGHIFPNTMVKSENKLFGLSLGNFRCFHWLYHLSKINDTKIESPIPNEVKSFARASMCLERKLFPNEKLFGLPWFRNEYCASNHTLLRD